MTLISPGDYTLQCGMWLWNHDSEFTKWQNPAKDDMPWNLPKRLPYWNSTSGFDFDHITAVDMLFCTSLHNLPKSDHPQEKKLTSCRLSRRQISAILGFRGPVMRSLKSPCTTSYKSSIETIALDCLLFEKIAFFCILATERQTDRQTNRQTSRWTASMHYAALTVTSGGLINDILHWHTLIHPKHFYYSYM